MKTRVVFLAVLIGFFSACTRNADELQPSPELATQEPLSPVEINKQINNYIAENGEFDWSEASDFLLWSAIVHGDSLIAIGYGDAPFQEGISKKNSGVKNYVIDLVSQSEQLINKKSNQQVLTYEHEIINVINVKAWNLATVTELRNDDNVRYVEPTGYRYFSYEPQKKSDSGCNKSSSSINSNDYRLISPNCYVSWVHDYHNIPAAWSYSTGSGIGVGVIDTGLSPSQNLLNGGINDGYSSGRYVRKYGTFVDSFWPWSKKTDGPNDKCSHGTSMAGNIASPRNNDYQPVGVAYNCNLVTYRATGDVVLNGGHEQKGVANALTALAKRSDVKVISMSIGHIFSVGKIKDAIKYAYAKGKLIIAAGGTSTSFTNFAGVIFPASMSETVAVTGVTDASGYKECAICHKGSKIDFTITMQRASDKNRTSPTIGFYNGHKQYIGGSSIATSTTAGIAALVWARHPSWTRTQVLNKLKQSADFYPNKNSKFGYGNIDALKAVK